MESPSTSPAADRVLILDGWGARRFLAQKAELSIANAACDADKGRLATNNISVLNANKVELTRKRRGRLLANYQSDITCCARPN
jgi:hypothetical protein